MEDRTVFLVAEGGTLLHGVAIGKEQAPHVRAVDATVDIAHRLATEYQVAGVCVDDTGLGGGVTDYLKRAGWRVVPINFGSSATDLPPTPEARASRQRQHLPDSYFRNMKMQLAWNLRGLFERQQVGLGRLPRAILDPLLQQASLVRTETTPDGRLRLVDLDEIDPEAAAGLITPEESRRSPDDLHALLLVLWASVGRHGAQPAPVGGALMTVAELRARRAVLGPTALQGTREPSRAAVSLANVSLSRWIRPVDRRW
jgi:hypothetical protein